MSLHDTSKIESESQRTFIDTDTDNDEDFIVKTANNSFGWTCIKPIQSNLRTFYLCLFCCIVIFTFIIMISIHLYPFKSNHTKTNSHDTDAITIEDYVLANTSLTVSVNNTNQFSGQFKVNDIKYRFKSISNITTEIISFCVMETNTKFPNWIGFNLNHFNESTLQIELLHTINGKYSIQFSHDTNQLDAHNTELLDTFLSDILSEHFVELSVKMGSLGYVGSDTKVIGDIHRFAQLIWKYETSVDYFGNIVLKSDQWVDISEEFEKVNMIHLSSQSAGFWVHNMNELMMYSTNQFSIHRRLLGNCNVTNECGNACFGSCGADCGCWSWVCGSCDCWKGCEAHDRFCSCHSRFHYCCWNVFWVRCDGSGTC